MGTSSLALTKANPRTYFLISTVTGAGDKNILVSSEASTQESKKVFRSQKNNQIW